MKDTAVAKGSFVNQLGQNDLSEYESARLEQNNVQA